MMNADRIIKENRNTHTHMQYKPLLTASHHYGGLQVYTILKNLKLLFPKQKKATWKGEGKLQNLYKLKASQSLQHKNKSSNHFSYLQNMCTSIQFLGI